MIRKVINHLILHKNSILLQADSILEEMFSPFRHRIWTVTALYPLHRFTNCLSRVNPRSLGLPGLMGIVPFQWLKEISLLDDVHVPMWCGAVRRIRVREMFDVHDTKIVVKARYFLTKP